MMSLYLSSYSYLSLFCIDLFHCLCLFLCSFRISMSFVFVFVSVSVSVIVFVFVFVLEMKWCEEELHWCSLISPIDLYLYLYL